MWNNQNFPEGRNARGKIVAIANQKGGVGKTTTAVNLSSCVSALGKKVLIVDLDPQGNTTTGYGIPKRSVECGTYEVLIGRATAAQAIRKTEFRTDVIGSNTRLAGASLEMIDLPGRESRLRKALAGVQKDYDFIFIDCPPSLDLLTLNGLSACDSVLIPVQCEYYALEGLSELISTLKTIRKSTTPIWTSRVWCSRCSPCATTSRCRWWSRCRSTSAPRCTKPRSRVRSASPRPPVTDSPSISTSQGQGQRSVHGSGH